MQRVILVFLVLYFGEVILEETPRVPPNPCPSIFNYYYDEDNTIFGEILVPNDGTKVFRMEVNTSYVGLFDETSRPKLKLELTTKKEHLLQAKQISYKLTFSRQDILPRLTQIKFNGRVYCTGPSEVLTSAGVSELWVFKETRLQSFTYINDKPQRNQEMSTKMPPFIAPRPTTTYPTIAWGNGDETGGNVPAAYTSNDSQIDSECGISDRTLNLISGEQSTVVSEFPWLVAVYKWHGLNYEFRCTGTLVDNSHIVTSAHCLKFYNSYLIKPEDILLVFGRSRLRHWAEKSSTVLRTVSTSEVHPDYRQYTGHGDIAVLTLAQPVEFSKSVKPVCLWRDREDLRYVVGKYGTVAGWGKDDKQLEYLVDSKKFEMPIVSEGTCLQSNMQFRSLVTDKTFCAGKRNGRGPCSADIGSALMIEKDGRWYLRGLLSQALYDRSAATCNNREYLVFADAAKYASWIRSKLI